MRPGELVRRFSGQTAGDPLWDKVVFLANFNDAISDARGHPITVTGNPTLGLSNPFAGGPSVRFDGVTASSLTLADSNDWTFPGDYCVEGWVWSDADSSGTVGIVDFGGIVNNNHQSQNIWLTHGPSILHFAASSNSSSPIFGDGLTGAVSALGKWSHYAITRAGSTYRVFWDGLIAMSGSSGAAPYNPSFGVLFGAYPAYSWNSALFALLKGALGPQRITKGAARYTANFTPTPEYFPVG